MCKIRDFVLENTLLIIITCNYIKFHFVSFRIETTQNGGSF